MHKYFSKTVKALTLATLVTGCGTTPIMSMWKLRSVDPLNTPPQYIKIALVTEQAMPYIKNCVQLTLGFDGGTEQTKFQESATVKIETNVIPRQLKSEIRENEFVSLFYLAEDESKAFALIQQKIKKMKSSKPDGKGWLNVKINDTCLETGLPDKLNSDIYLNLSKNIDYILLAENIDLMLVR